MQRWEILGTASAPDGTELELRQRGHEFRIRAGGHELMSSEDGPSSRSLAELGCAHLSPKPEVRVLVGGLGMGHTLRAALDMVRPGRVEVAELVEAVVTWNQGVLGPLADHPLRDPSAALFVGDVRTRIRATQGELDAILLDVDNGPIALAHQANNALYRDGGLREIHRALKPGGVIAVWSLMDDARFVARLRRNGFDARAQAVFGSRRDRGREHVIFVGQKVGDKPPDRESTDKPANKPAFKPKNKPKNKPASSRKR